MRLRCFCYESLPTPRVPACRLFRKPGVNSAAVYTVKICRHPHCTCPDHAKGHVCKHILFVMLRVLKLSTTNPLAWQKALLTKEVCAALGGLGPVTRAAADETRSSALCRHFSCCQHAHGRCCAMMIGEHCL